MHKRRVRSFVRRAGRATEAQQKAIKDLLPRWGIEYLHERLDLNAAFGRSATRVLDIGFGNGEALVSTAASLPGVDFLGVEVHEPGIGHLLVIAEQAGITNLRVIKRDVVDVIDAMLGPAAFDAVNIFFPDPWPKKRHHKRRLIQAAFVEKLAMIMRPGGLLHVATDWSGYAEHILNVMEESGEFRRTTAAAVVENPLAHRPPTKFERRGLELGHTVSDMYYMRCPNSA